MISFMISVVPPKFHGIRGLPQELPLALAGLPRLFTDGYGQDVAGAG